MLGSTSSAPTPDPAIGDAANKQAQLGEAWLQFSKDQFAISNTRQTELDALTKRVTEQQMGIATDQAAWSKADRARYETVYKPAEDQFVSEALNYATPEKQAEAAATAKADIQSAAASARGASERNAASMGLNPTSGRFAGIDRVGELSTTLATAGAANTARQAVRDKGLALKADVVNLGRGMPSQAAQAASLGLSAGGSAVGLNQSNQNLFNASTGIVGSGYQGASSGYGAQAAGLTGVYQGQLSAYNTEQQANASTIGGIASAAGLGAGMIFKSDENLKEDKAPIAEGDALDAVNAMPVETWKYKQGVADEGEHVGTYAQDFQRETGSGDGHTIAAQDAIGLTMKAVQDLDAKIDKIAKAVGLGGATQSKPRGTVTQMKPKPKPAAVSEQPPLQEGAPLPPDAMPGLGMRRAA